MIRLENKFDIIELSEDCFTKSELLDMFIFWLDLGEVERCFEDFLKEHDLKLNQEKYIIE